MQKVNFIHIPKNGGQAIKTNTTLRPFLTTARDSTNLCSPEYVTELLATMKKYGEHHGKAHARWRDWDTTARQRRTFAIVRNPWARTYSRWTFMNIILDNRGEKHTAGYQRCTFEEFLEQRHTYGSIPFFWHRAVRGWYQQMDYVTDTDGNLKCDVLRTEHLNEDVERYFGFDPNMLRRNVSNIKKIDYRTVYTPETKQIVADWYARDIEFFGFDFDSCATKNTYYD